MPFSSRKCEDLHGNSDKFHDDPTFRIFFTGDRPNRLQYGAIRSSVPARASDKKRKEPKNPNWHKISSWCAYFSVQKIKRQTVGCAVQCMVGGRPNNLSALGRQIFILIKSNYYHFLTVAVLQFQESLKIYYRLSNILLLLPNGCIIRKIVGVYQMYWHQHVPRNRTEQSQFLADCAMQVWRTPNRSGQHCRPNTCNQPMNDINTQRCLYELPLLVTALVMSPEYSLHYGNTRTQEMQPARQFNHFICQFFCGTLHACKTYCSNPHADRIAGA